MCGHCPLWVISGHGRLFDHFVGARKKARRYFEAESFSRLKIESQFVFGWCLYRKVSRFLALEDPIYVGSSRTKPIDWIRTIRNEPSVFNEETTGIYCGQPVAIRESYQPLAMDDSRATQ